MGEEIERRLVINCRVVECGWMDGAQEGEVRKGATSATSELISFLVEIDVFKELVLYIIQM